MLGEFTSEDRSGNITFASSPGMDSSSIGGRTDSKKSKPSTKRIPRRPLMSLFVDLATDEPDEQWEERFTKMAASKFPPKISWDPTTEENEDHLLGKMVYKNRQINNVMEIPKSLTLSEIRERIKTFVLDYTNIDMDKDDDYDDEIIQPVDKTTIIPMSWNKMSARDQVCSITDYAKSFSFENGLSRDHSERFISHLIVHAMGRNIFPLLTFDSNGNIDKIKGIHKDSSGEYRLK